MADTTHTIGSTGVVKKLVDLGDDTYADAVVDFNNGSIAETAAVLAAPTGSDGGLGKLPATIANTEFFYVRCDTSARPYTYVDWIVSHAQQADLAFYKSQSIVDEVTLTLASFADSNTAVLNGLTYTGEETADDAAYASRKFLTGVGDTDDAAALAALINADYAVTTAGTSVAATDKLTVTTDEGAHVITAAAAADYPASKYKLSSTQATELTSIVAAINHKDTVTFQQDATAFAATNPAVDEAGDYALSIELIADHNTHTASTVFHYAATAAAASTAATTEETLVAQVNVARTAMLAHYADASAHGVADATNLATVAATSACTDAATARTLVNALAAAHLAHIATAKRAAGDTVTVNGLVFTAKTGAADAATRKFSIDTSADATGASFIAVANDATYGVPGLTATNASGVVSFARDSEDDTVTVSVANAATHPHQVMTIEAAGGVPGVVAAETGATGELSITPTWSEALTVTEAGTKLTVVDIDNPGILAAAALAVVTLTPGTPAGTDGELATVIYATAAANCTVDESATLAGLMIDSGTTAVADEAATTGTAGTIEPAQAVGGYKYCYLKFTADNATPQAVSISAVKRI